ncbi:MAG TPA: DUF1501 domain-containing protein [Blastocatellia bacterium]|nr:DUF1501 domain-containing protein [Blastocatellia bacterium]
MAKHHHYGHECGTCKPLRGVNSPLTGPEMPGRRNFFKLAGAGVAGYFLTPLLTSEVKARPTADLHLIGKARNCIFILLSGAPSNVDTFDLKVGSWTPADFNATSYNGVMFPQGLMPNLASQLNRMTIVRNLRAPALVHPLQRTWAQIARSPSSALGKVAPNLGSVVALEFEPQRKPNQKLPVFVSLNTGGDVVGAGYFNGLYSPFDVTAAPTGLGSLVNSDGPNTFNTRYGVLQSIDASLRTNSPLGDDVTTMGGFYDRGKSMMYDTAVSDAFKFTTDEQTRYGNSAFGNSCIVARNLAKGDLGTRYIQINHGGWDNHQDIYDRVTGGIYDPATELDQGLANLLTDLAAAPGVNGGSVLDETLVVAMGEFGRTVGEPTDQAGRDHYFQHFAVFAGGGVAGGRVIGETIDTGGAVKDPGWSQGRPTQYEDIAATIYAAMGINYMTIRHDDPFGRGFEYVPFANEGAWYPILEVFDRGFKSTPRVVPKPRETGRKVS